MLEKDINTYLERSKEFWNVPKLEVAMYRRILTNFSKPFDELSIEEEYRNWLNVTENNVKTILEDIKFQSNWNVLEIGCGIGRLIKPFREIFDRVDGVDISETMVNFSQEYLKGTENKGNVYLNDGKSFKMLNDDFYNFVFSFITIQHIRSCKIVKEYFNEAYRVLKKDGIFKFQVIKTNSDYGKFNEEPNPAINYNLLGNSYNKEELNKILSEAKFSCINIVDNVNNDSSSLWATCYK